jgi:hypothetical protein
VEFNTLLQLIGDDPVFESSLLLAGDINPKIVRLQLSRWVKSWRIYQLRRGLYVVAPPYQKVKPHPFLIANHLQRASYVSLQTALAYYGLIPETVTSTVSVTAGRPEHLETPLGVFDFRHIKPQLLTGYQMIDFGGQSAFLASPEKALLDLIYLQPGGENAFFLQELRLQNLDRLDPDLLKKLAVGFDSPKMHVAVQRISQLLQTSMDAYEEL